jgi:transposase InsO family protein
MVSDISYIFGSNGKLLGYATSLLDGYSRRLLGLSFSQTMHAAVTVQAVLDQALKVRKKKCFDGLIFHSDGGKQYIEKHFLNTLAKHTILSSMAENCYENPHAEAFNDTLKNHMLHDTTLNSYTQLKQNEDFTKNCYNTNKTHSALSKITPVAFEQHLLNLQPCQRTPLKIKVLS